MKSGLVLLFFGCLVTNTISRPRQREYNNEGENTEEVEEEEENDTYAAEDEDTGLSDRQESAGQEEEVPRSRHLLDLGESKFLQHNVQADSSHGKSDAVLDLKSNRDMRDDVPNDTGNLNEEHMRSPQKYRQSNRYNDANEVQQELQHLTNREASKSNRILNPDKTQINKRTSDETTTDEEGVGDLLFENNDELKNRKTDNNDEISHADQLRYYSQYHNTMQAQNRELSSGKNRGRVRYNRDRRDAMKENEVESSNSPNSQGNSDSNEETDSEDEEAAIKRHIKTLSSDELEQLFSTLSGEKRDLLKKIIDDTPGDYALINKREITKKAGAVEENNYIENCQTDLSKVQGGSSLNLNTESPSSSSTDMTEAASTKVNENSEATQKSSDSSLTSVIKLDLAGSDDALKKVDNNLNTDSKTQLDSNSQENVASKTETKREVNLDELNAVDVPLDETYTSGQDDSNIHGDFSSEDENSSNFLDDESEPQEEKYKREAAKEQQTDLSNSVKSLEESFPNSHAYDESGPYTGPLVRVKRKSYDPVIKKRSAGLLPDTKVAYVPYKAENEDEDNDEGSEFDDEGFYDRTNLENRNKVLQNVAEGTETNIQKKTNDNSETLNEHDESNSSLGSDTDNVLSGVEGVDDNLMYNANRGRRNLNDSSNTAQAKQGDPNSMMEEEMKPAYYQENDAVRQVPRTYDGDASRYKRIKRVKQVRNNQEFNSDIE